MDTIVQRMQDTFERQRVAFLAHPFPSLSERKTRLKALRALLKRYQDRIATAVSADFGGRSPAETKLVEVLGPILEINHALHRLRQWMQPQRRATELLFFSNSARVNYQPKGVVGVITPWNFPLYLSLGPLVAALAAGNRVMIKMSELSPRTTELLAQMLAESFAEDEVAVFGGEVAEAQAFSHLPFNYLVFTGSPAVGHHITRAAAQHLTPVTLELGGKSPALVANDRAVEMAAERIAHGKAFSSGQVCLAPDYALVPRGHVDAFASAVERSFRRLYPTVQGNHDYTSMACEPHAQRIRELLAEATAKGGKVIACGDNGAGRRIPLHVVTGVRDDMRIANEELFGPILPVVAYDTLDQAIDYIAARPRPLALYAFGFGGAEVERLTSVRRGSRWVCSIRPMAIWCSAWCSSSTWGSPTRHLPMPRARMIHLVMVRTALPLILRRRNASRAWLTSRHGTVRATRASSWPAASSPSSEARSVPMPGPEA